MFPSCSPLQHHGQSSLQLSSWHLSYHFPLWSTCFKVQSFASSLGKYHGNFKIHTFVFQKHSAGWDPSAGFCVSPSFWTITFVPVLSRANPSTGSLFPTNTNVNDQRLSHTTKYVFHELSYCSVVSSMGFCACRWSYWLQLMLHVALVVFPRGRRKEALGTADLWVLCPHMFLSTGHKPNASQAENTKMNRTA